MKHQHVQEVVGNRGLARSGATSAWFGEFRVRKGAPRCSWELSGSVSGSFRSSEIGCRSPLSDRFGGMFDFKAGRWHCGAHAMAENTESHETCSILSTNAVNVHIFFQGRLMWPLARKSADPVERVGSWKKKVLVATSSS